MVSTKYCDKKHRNQRSRTLDVCPFLSKRVKCFPWTTARRSGRASFQRTALEHGWVSNWSCCRVATQPCWQRFYFVVPLHIKREMVVTWPWSHTKLFLGDFCGRTRQVIVKSSLKDEGLVALPLTSTTLHWWTSKPDCGAVVQWSMRMNDQRGDWFEWHTKLEEKRLF